MEVSASAITSALRVGVQVIVSQKRPILEIYQQLHNEFTPPFELDRSKGRPLSGKTSHRFQHVFIDLTLVNVGGVRAENVSFEVKGEFKRGGLREELPGLFISTVRQLPPGQSIYLMKIDDHDLNVYEAENPENPEWKKAVGLKTLTILCHYDGPNTIWNRLLRWSRRWRGLKQYTSEYTFDPANFVGDLPPAKYNG
ncbi:hypothetical protein HNQ96_005153 [Aminobacter lissarensis]|uniref:Uncharacterized protein n=1 Tax=Aminobacter carboxidus TaxID=376165 RepID=A0A8E1WKG6_9HYPH|nr:hypothetical protein [Aminobacter lissarensis]MBB6469264.1 hypothetical protein [Aminobacter lissarensis]